MSLLSRKIVDAVSVETVAGDLTVDDGRYQLTLDLRASDPNIGAAFGALTFSPLDSLDLTIEAIRSWADRLVARLTYLLEPLLVLEVDTLRREVVIRSQVPSQRDDRLAYYELRLQREGSARLRRIAYDRAASKRSVFPCSLSHEALERITDDLVSTSC